MKYAYVTLLSTNSYFLGVLALFESLKKTNPKVKEFVVLVNDGIKESNINTLKELGYKVIEKNKIDMSSTINNHEMEYWMHTFDKLNVFELTEYDKIVFLDSDMQILKNLDELFEYPHLSAAPSGREINPEWTGMNSGLMVIEPKEGEVKRILEGIKDHNFPGDIGDQDIINYYYQWSEQNLSIPEKFNVFARYLDYYLNNCGYYMEDIYIIHYIGSYKPWMLSEEELTKEIEELENTGCNYQAKYLKDYVEIINKIEEEIRKD